MSDIHSYDLSEFVNDLNSLDIHLSDDQLEQFVKYYELLVEWNSFMNLTGITEWKEVCKKHFIDSLSIVKAYDLKNVETIIDIGTGAGFPGLPIKIAFPHLKVTLLDSLNKRIDFLNHVINQLGLSDIIAVHGRAEDFIKEEGRRESYDLCVSRAVSSLSVLSEYCVPYIKVGGMFVPYKSEKTSEELQSSKNAFDILGCQIQDVVEFNLPSSDIFRTMLLIKKTLSTPIKYPRKAGTPLKKPL